MPVSRGALWAAEMEQCLRDERGFLLRLAYAQLRDTQEAADAVQEMALAAWQSIHRFEGRSTMRTWLVGILRFKILDALRARKQQPIFVVDEAEQEMQAFDSEAVFGSEGCWDEEPQAWWEACDGPSESLQQSQAMRLLEQCLEKLPNRMAQIFLMREYLGFESAEITQRTGVQAGNIRVILMRARLALRTCLEWQLSPALSRNES